MFIKPWNEESEKIMRQLSISGRAFTKDMTFSRNFGKKRIRKELGSMGFLEMYHRVEKSFANMNDIGKIMTFRNLYVI